MNGLRQPNRWLLALFFVWGILAAGTASLYVASSCGESSLWEIREIDIESSGLDVTPTMDVRGGGELTLWVNYFDDGEDRHLYRADYDEVSGAWGARKVRVPNEPNGVGKVLVHEFDGRVRALSRVYGWNRRGNDYTYLDGFAGSDGPGSSEWYSIDRFKTMGGKYGRMVWVDFFAFYRDGVLYGHHQNSDLFKPSLFLKAGEDELVYELERFSFDTLAVDDSHRHALLGGTHAKAGSNDRVFYVLDHEGRPTIRQPGVLGSSGALAVGSDGTLHSVWFHQGKVVHGRLEPGDSAWNTTFIGPEGSWEQAHVAIDEDQRLHFVMMSSGDGGNTMQYVRMRDGEAVIEPIATGLSTDTRILAVDATDTTLHVVFQKDFYVDDTSFHHAERGLD